MQNRPSLPLDISRADLIKQAAQIIGDAWSSFDQARPIEPAISEVLRELTTKPLGNAPTPALAALEEARGFLDTSLAQSRPRYFAFVGSSGLEIGVLADALASCFDVNLATSAKSADLIERQALEWVAQLLGFPSGAGTITSGGMISNLTALTAARERALPNVRRTGLANRPCGLYCSSEAHYSVSRAAEVLGIGANQVRSLAMDAQHRVKADEVAKAIDADIAAGIIPVAVVATAGTTLTGAIDPLEELANICAARGVWLHVDGAYGLPGAAVLEMRNRFAGLERADSISVDAHKWLYLPKACGVVLVKNRSDLAAAFTHDESYMLHDEHQPYNAVDLTLEYSRPFRALKLWLALRVHGADQYRAAIARNIAQAQLCAKLIRASSELELLIEPQLSTVPFRHVPKSLKGNETVLNQHNLELVKTMQDDGRVYISSALVDGKICLRPCFVNFRTSDSDVQTLIDVTLELGTRVLARD
jgi:aromatic-L-amino-acid/L-tryptophan decarboxylase